MVPFCDVGPRHATAIAADAEVIKNLGLVTSHGFTVERRKLLPTPEIIKSPTLMATQGAPIQPNKPLPNPIWFGDHRSDGNDLLRLQRPGLHSWTTSMTWGDMNSCFVEDIRGQIYGVKVNAVIPWAAVQTAKWVGGDPNPGTAVRIHDDCHCYTIEPGCYFYKQVTRVGQPGMYVAGARSSVPGISAIAFASNGTKHPDALVIVNLTERTPVTIKVNGTKSRLFAAYRTSQSEKYASIGEFKTENAIINIPAPEKSVTTFFAK